MTSRQQLMVTELTDGYFLAMDNQEQLFLSHIEFEDRELDEEQEFMLKELYERHIGYGFVG